MQLFIEHEDIVDTTGDYASSINRKIKLPHQTINNMFCIQLLSYGHLNVLFVYIINTPSDSFFA